MSLEAVLARMLAAGQITPDDADEIREFAAYLREPVDPLGRSEFQRAMPSVSETAAEEAADPDNRLGPLRQGWA